MRYSLIIFQIRFNADFETPLAEKEWVQVVHWEPERIDLCDYAGNVDYLLLWDTPDESIVAEAIQRCYTLIASEGKLKLYKGTAITPRGMAIGYQPSVKRVAVSFVFKTPSYLWLRVDD